MINIQKMMQQAQKVQAKLSEMQESFKDIEVQGESGGGLVKVTMACDGSVRKIDTDPGIINAEDKETMEDLITAAVNNASEAKDRKIEEETRKMMEEMGLPADAAGGLGGGLPF